jgi:hypothetical protein
MSPMPQLRSKCRVNNGSVAGCSWVDLGTQPRSRLERAKNGIILVDITKSSLNG